MSGAVPGGVNATVQRMRHLSACDEAVEWAQHVKSPDMHTGWLAMDQPQWMMWVAIRVLDVAAVPAFVACVRALDKLPAGGLLPPPALATLDLMLAYAAGKRRSAADEERLLTGAYDAASHGLFVGGPPGSALLAVSYGAHCVHKLVAAQTELKDENARREASIKASGHVADAMLHVLLAAEELYEKLPSLIRSHIDERALAKAWHAIPDTPPKAPSPPVTLKPVVRSDNKSTR